MERADASIVVLAARANPGWRMRAARLVVRLVPMLVAGWIGLAGSAALAADAIVLSVAGTATAEGAPAAPGLRALRNGSELFEGDVVRTGDDGRVQFRFTDGGLVSLQPRTEFRIDEYRHGGASQRSFFSLLRGALRTATGAIGRRDRDDYRLRTPTATVGIRGTEFLAEETVCDPRCAPGPTAGLRISVTQGRIAVTTGAGSIEVGQGQSAVVDGPDALPRLTAAGPILAPRALAHAGQSPGTGNGGGRSPAVAPTADSSAPIPGTPDATASGAAAAGATDSVGGQTPGSPFRLAGREPSEAGVEPTTTAAGKASTAAGTASPKTLQGAPADGDWPADRAQPITVALVPTVPGLPLAPPSAGDAVSPNNERGPDGELSAVTDALADDPGSGGPGPGDPGPGDPDPGDPDPGDPGPGDPGPGDPGPGDPGPGDPGPG
ncbi:MAG: hypothetical protein GX644_08020, partial [Limnobacter sp.]|nr:hypothetical protein [Limnobacter sp.]